MAIALTELTGAADGKGVLISGTASAGANVVHTADSTAYDQLFLQAHNEATTAKWIKIEWGETSNPIIITIPPQAGLVTIADGHILTNSLTCEIFAETTNVVKVFGYVLRHS